MTKEVTLGEDSRKELLKGANILANAVKVTLGSRGRNVYIDNMGIPYSTKDGVTVAKAIDLEDEKENMGAKIIREAAIKTADIAGDGTTTATVLAQAIANEGNKAVVAGYSPTEVKKGIEKATKAIVKYIDENAKSIDGNKEIEQIATVSANHEKEIGEIIVKAIEKVGKDGVITVQESTGLETTLETVEGMQFDRGYLSPYFINNPEKMTVEYSDPYILLVDGRVSTLQPIQGLLEEILQSGRPFIVIAEDIDGEALNTLVVNRIRGNVKFAAVKAPSFGTNRKAIMQDLATLTGGRLISEETGDKLANTTVEMLGSCKKINIKKDTTTIVEGAGTKESLGERCKALKAEIEQLKSEYEKKQIRERLGKLTSGVAIIKVGGATESEVKERKDRVDDALQATRAAIDSGIVAGGGATLLYASETLKDIAVDNQDQKLGVEIICKALKAPIKQIADNAGADGSVVVGNLLRENKKEIGFDAQKEEYVNMIEAGIIDPAKVVKTAIQSASSVAGLLLTTEALITEKKKNKQNQPQGLPM